MPTLFISDLHLSAEQPEITRLFINFLHNQAIAADALYILGDLFEVWLGDDMILPDYQDAIAAMKKLSESGVPIYVMHGNRDFLLGQQFAEQSGCYLIEDPYTIDLYGTPVLLMHGDTLCTDDVKYQEFRRMVRDENWQQQFLAKTPEERLAMAREYRDISKAETGNKAEEIMDVNPDAVDHAMRSHDVTLLIHGHTHRPGVHFMEINTHPARRIVLGDWNRQGSVLVASPNGITLDTLELE